MGILVYAPYKKSAIHKLSTVRAMPIIADAMKQDQVWNKNLQNIWRIFRVKNNIRCAGYFMLFRVVFMLCQDYVFLLWNVIMLFQHYFMIFFG